MESKSSYLGKQVKDSVTGFVGIAIAHAVYLHGSPSVLITGLDAASRPVEHWIEVERAVICD